MLTSDLVLARLYRGQVKPRYVDGRDAELLQLAAQLIAIFADHAGRSRESLDQELKELLGSGTDFLLHRALAKLLTDRCEFETASDIEPEALRHTLFSVAAEHYRREMAEGTAFSFQRPSVISQAAEALGLDSAAVEAGLYADLKGEQVLTGWKPCRAEWLLDRYNVALAQGVLLRATEMVLRIEESSITRQRELFRRIKFFRLLHRLKSDGRGGWVVHLDGPLSVFKSSGKYGIQMANFLPTLLHFDAWSLEAQVAWGKKRRKAKFKLDSSEGLRPISAPLKGQWQPEELTWFPQQFAKLESQWQVSSEADIVTLGGQSVLVPDFVFEHADGFRVVMEVMGFWRRGSLERRLEELRRLGPKQLILAVSKQLLTEDDDLEDLPDEVFLFRQMPVARKVHAFLEKRRQA